MTKRTIRRIVASVILPFTTGLAFMHAESKAAAQTADKSIAIPNAQANPLAACSPMDGQCLSTVIACFRPNNFSFVTIVPDDGKGPAGGWQESNTVLAFANNLFEIVSCAVRIGMPIRPQAYGTIPPTTAAVHSAAVANTAAANVWPTKLPQGIFCTTFKKEMVVQFKAKYPDLGARIMNP